MSRQQSPPAPDDDNDHVLLDAHRPHPPSSAPPPRSPPPPPTPDPLRRPPPSHSHQHPSLTPSASQSSSFQPQTTHNARQQLGPGPDQRQHQQHQLQQPIQPIQLQPTPSSPVQSYPQQNRQIALEPQRPSTSSPKHQSAKGGVRGRITVVCAEVLLFSLSSLPRAHHPDLQCKRLKLRCDRQRYAPPSPPSILSPPTDSLALPPHRPCTSCVKRACTERCKYRSELDFVPPPDPPSKPSVDFPSLRYPPSLPRRLPVP